MLTRRSGLVHADPLIVKSSFIVLWPNVVMAPIPVRADRLAAELDRFHARISGRFIRSEPRQRARQYLSGLLAALDRKNGWTLAERAGDRTPDGMQRLLRLADWDVDEVRDHVRDYVIENLGDRDGVLVAGDTEFSKKGVRSAGVARQFNAATGRIENCQTGVFLAYLSEKGHALVDRRLYLPKEWTADRTRSRAAGIPDHVAFATKAQIAEHMLAAAFAAGIRPTRVATDPERRRALEQCFRQAREQTGLDQYQVRDWRAWHAHITLSMAALACLVVAEQPR